MSDHTDGTRAPLARTTARERHACAASAAGWYVQRSQLGIYHPAEVLDLPVDVERPLAWAQVELPDIVHYPYLLSLHTTLMFFGGNTNNSLQLTIEKILGSFTMLTGTIVTAVIVSQVSVLMASLMASERL